MRPTFRSFVVATVLVCGVVWWYGRFASSASSRAVVTNADATAVCFRMTSTSVPAEAEICIDAVLVAEPLSSGDCIELRRSHPGFEVAGRTPCR